MLRPRVRARALLRLLSNLLIAAGVVLLGASGLYAAYLLYSHYQIAQINAETLAMADDGLQLPPPGVELREEPPIFLPGDPMTEPQFSVRPPASHIRIPSIGVDSQIVELGTTLDEKGELVWETPKHAVGHHLGTANPGEAGNVVLSGHISSPIKKEGNVFSRLPQLQPGAAVTLETPEGAYTYRVTARRVVEPTEVSVMAPTPLPTLTLITCYPDWVYTHRLVVTAEPVGFQPPEG